ncbi:unnamed protein product, partial [Tenebrio molitor]
MPSVIISNVCFTHFLDNITMHERTTIEIIDPNVQEDLFVTPKCLSEHNIDNRNHHYKNDQLFYLKAIINPMEFSVCGLFHMDFPFICS